MLADRLKKMRGGRRALALMVAFTVALPASAAHAAPAPKPPSRSAPADRLPGEESLAERRAVRGAPVDDVATPETPELRELRRFEEQAFPRTGAAPLPAPDTAMPPPSLPGSWGGSGDVPPELRSTATQPATGAPPPDSDWLRALKLPDLPVRWDPQVLRYLDYFKSDPKGRSVMSNWLRRAGRYRDVFDKVLARYGLPRDLFYLAMIESGFESAARSRVGAGGVWQFMPSAARAYGLEVSYWIDGRRDPERAADAAARYLKDLYVRFGSWYLVFAAYNAGYGAVLRSITNYNTNDYWELVKHESGLPWESSLYVPKILAAAIVGRNQAAFGFADVAPDAPFAYEEVEVPGGTTLATVARAAGAKTEVIESLNPHLLRSRTPPERGTSRVRVPVGTAAIYAANIDKARSADKSDKVDMVTLRFGETLDEVARARGVNVRELRRLNGVKDSTELRAGTTIVVPAKKATTTVASAKDRGKDGAAKDDDDDARDAPASPAAAADDDTVLVAVPDRSFSYDGRERVFYRARDGDSLDEIGDAFGVRTDELCEWNNVDPSAKLHPRMVLQIFVRKDFDPSGVMLLDPTKVRVVTLGSEEFLELETARRGKKRLYYTAKSGDTLVKLGRRYGLTPGDLARINRFSYNTELHEGDRLVVYSPTGDTPHEHTMGMTPGKKRPERGTVTTPPRAPEATAKAKPKATTAIAKADTKPATKPAVKSEKNDKAKPADKTSAKRDKPADKVADKSSEKSGAKKK
jgi:membrane-bound lytic murein transglycosylase D